MEFVEPRSGSLNYDTNAVSDETGLECKDKSLTIQSQAADADINVIMKRFGVTGAVPVVALPPEFGDFSVDIDFRKAMDIMNTADRSFMSLTADIRARFLNDPLRFVEFVADPKNIDEVRKLGLAPEKIVAPDPVPMKVEVVNPFVSTEAKPK